MGAAGLWLRLGDLDGDGDMDAVIGAQSGIQVHSNDGTGTFSRVQTVATGTPNLSVELMDLNHDGRLDLAWSNSAGSAINYSLQTGTGLSFAAAQTFVSGLSSFSPFTKGDVNNDGVDDLVISTSTRFLTYLADNYDAAAVSELTVASAAEAQRLLEIVEQGLQRLSEERATLGGLHSRLEFGRSNGLVYSENLEEARAILESADVALEVAELTRLQILQNAQVAVAAQANLQLGLVLGLLKPLQG